MNLRPRPRTTRGFSRVDLVALIFVVFLGAAVANPLFLSPARSRSETLVCQDNLGRIGRAFQLWTSDHDDLHPFLIASNQGGLQGHLLMPNSFIQFAWVSNGLVTPKVLACPADTNTIRRATDFSRSPNGGFMNPAYQNNAVSYFLSFHARRYLPRSILCGDPNVEPRQFVGCVLADGYQLRNMHVRPQGGSQWNQQIHWLKGNVLFNDGSVEETSTSQLRSAMLNSGDSFGGGSGDIHVLFPR